MGGKQPPAMSPSAVMAPGRVATARWNDPLPESGTRILVCRYRPRGGADKERGEHPREGQTRDASSGHRAHHAPSSGARGSPSVPGSLESRPLRLDLIERAF